MKTFAGRVDYLQGAGDAQVANRVAEFLDGRPKDRPFFMWANFSDPHHVWDAPNEFRPDPKLIALPAHWPDLPGVREQVADYCAEVNRLDQSVGAVIGELEKRGLLDALSRLAAIDPDPGVRTSAALAAAEISPVKPP